MAIPDPDSLLAVIKVTADTSDEFLAKLGAQMADPTTVKNGYRGTAAQLFSFYVPGAMWSKGFDEVRKELVTKGYTVHVLQQIQGYMPSNEIIDFVNIDSTDVNVTGPSTFAWIHVQVSKTPTGN
jgi:hypothetical protein